MFDCTARELLNEALRAYLDMDGLLAFDLVSWTNECELITATRSRHMALMDI